MNNLTGSTGSGTTGSAVTGGSALGNNPGGLGASNAGGHTDMGDKVFDAAAKKSGHNVNASTGEKITDGARGLFEKATG